MYNGKNLCSLTEQNKEETRMHFVAAGFDMNLLDTALYCFSVIIHFFSWPKGPYWRLRKTRTDIAYQLNSIHEVIHSYSYIIL